MENPSGKAHPPPRCAQPVHCRTCGTTTTDDPRGQGHPWCPHCDRPDWVNPAPAVGVAIERAGQVLLARRGEPPKKDQWDLIGGFVEPGETVPEAARREVAEETGLEIERLQRLHQAAGEYVPGQPTLNFIYLARAAGDPTARDDVAEVRWFDLAALPTMAWPHENDALERLRRHRQTAEDPA